MAINDIPYLEIDLPGILVVGADGKNAYEVACEKGFVGTLEDWLNYQRGPQGVGIAKVYQVEESEEDEGENTIRFLLTDGQIVDIVIRNGSQGPTGTFSEEDAARMDTMEQDIADLKYVPIAITSLSSLSSIFEKGSKALSLSAHWSLNKTPVLQNFYGVDVDPDARKATVSGLSITDTTTATLRVTDERGHIASQSITYKFLNGVYYGVLEDGAAIDSDAILTLTKNLQDKRGITFTVNPGSTQRIAYAIPASYGTPTFKDAGTGFQADMYLADTIEFKNEWSHTETYNVWLSTNIVPGSITVAVT